MKKYLVIYYVRGDGTIGNVGLFNATDKVDAERQAKSDWKTMAELSVFDLEEIPEGWSFFY